MRERFLEVNYRSVFEIERCIAGQLVGSRDLRMS